MFILHGLHYMPEICQFNFTWRQINDIVAKDENFSTMFKRNNIYLNSIFVLSQNV